MNTEHSINYNRVAEAIGFIHKNFKGQPKLEEVANAVNLSPAHFQRIFTEWSGVSPKKFIGFLTLEYAKSLLKDNQSTLFDASLNSGLSGTGRLHDLFVSIEGMTPGEYKRGGIDVIIKYSYSGSIFGDLIIASTHIGICYIAFIENEQEGLQKLVSKFPNAAFKKEIDSMHESALSIFKSDWSNLTDVKLHLKGTDFQLNVWKALLNIPTGKLSTYGTIASKLNAPGASRAVGSAIGDNPVAFLIPCHRVIQSSGTFGHYMWGPERKMAMIGWEAANITSEHN